MKKGIASQFFFAFSGITILTISILGLVLTYFTNYYFGNENTQQLIQSAQTVINSVNRFIEDESYEVDDLMYNFQIIGSSTNTIVHFMDIKEEYIACSNDTECELDLNVDSTIEFFKTLKTENKPINVQQIEPVNEADEYRVKYSVYDEDGNHIGYIELIGRGNSLILFVDSLSTIFVLSAGLILIIASIVSFFLTSRIVTPITKVSNAAKAFSDGDFSARVEGNTGAQEIANLAETFNIMASFLENHEVSLSSFVANISHELRTPMTSIKGFVDGVLDGTIDGENQKKYLKIVSDEIGRLARLTNSMLQMSRVEAGEYIINAESYSIWDTVSAVAIALEQTISEKNITIDGFNPTDIQIFADADITHQVVYNIFDNAVKFTPNNGTIKLNIFEDKAEDFIVLKIRNNGAGIPRDELPYIFERFYKSDKSRSENKNGTGIGLYIVHTLLQRTGGKVEVKSVIDEYTEFSIYFPAHAIHAMPSK